MPAVRRPAYAAAVSAARIAAPARADEAHGVWRAVADACGRMWTLPRVCRSPGAGSSVDKLEDALDELAETGRHFMGRYLVGSNVERRSGGQGVVQFARIANTPDQVAIKFYTHREVRSLRARGACMRVRLRGGAAAPATGQRSRRCDRRWGCCAV